MRRALTIACAMAIASISLSSGAEHARPLHLAGGQPAPTSPAQPAKPKARPLFRPLDLGLIEPPDRDEWQPPDPIMDALNIAEGSVVADLGAGGGWFTTRVARRVLPTGIVYAQDIQALMLEALKRRAVREGLPTDHVITVLGTATDPKLPHGIDAVLIVGAYHEMDDPTDPTVIVTLLRNVAAALRPQGRVGVVDFNPGSGGPGPAPDERPDPQAVIKAAAAAGLQVMSQEVIQPFKFQYLLVFGKEQGRSREESTIVDRRFTIVD